MRRKIISATIPITRNYEGKKLVNVNVMKALGIDPKPAVLRDVKLMKTD